MENVSLTAHLFVVKDYQSERLKLLLEEYRSTIDYRINHPKLGGNIFLFRKDSFS